MINWEKFRPILVVPAVPNNDGIRFLRQDKQLDINGDIVSTLWKILSLCNGYRTLDEISELSKLEKEFIKNIFIELLNQELISDSCEQYRHFHTISSYPTKYLKLLNEEEVKAHKHSKRKSVKEGTIVNFDPDKNSLLYKLQKNRKSCRNFSVEKDLTLSQLGSICDYAYSLNRHATPSGGALFPLKIYCIVTRNQIDLKAGYYEYDAEKNKLILYNKEPDLEQLRYCFNDETLAFNSPIQIVIGADLDRQPYKYSNRGYRLTLIEVGHVAQNISLYCEEQGLSTCELGGILDKPLAIELGLVECGIAPILAVAVGYSSNKKIFKYSEFLSYLAKEYVGEEKPVKNFGINSLNIEDASFYGAWVKYGTNGNRIAGATASSYNESICKAIIEGYERFRSGIIRVDYTGPAKNSKEFFKPNEIAPLSSEQRNLWGLKQYFDGDIIEWTKDMSDKYYLPTDFVYYGHKKANKLFFSDSSGIAAYSSYEEAKKRAVAELIERDAVMRSWYQQKSPKHVSQENISLHIKKRIKHWENKGRKIHLLDLDSKYLPVFLVIIVSDEYPCFVSGASASIGNSDSAMLKALQEAEYNLLLAIENPISEPPNKEDVKTPQEHGQYYHFPSNAQKISWLWSNNEYSNKKYYDSYNFNQIIKNLGIVFVDFSESIESNIKVVRAISKQLIPISFGYKRDYYLHPKLKGVKISSLSKNIPHYFA